MVVIIVEAEGDSVVLDEHRKHPTCESQPPCLHDMTSTNPVGPGAPDLNALSTSILTAARDLHSHSRSRTIRVRVDSVRAVARLLMHSTQTCESAGSSVHLSTYYHSCVCVSPVFVHSA